MLVGDFATGETNGLRIIIGTVVQGSASRLKSTNDGCKLPPPAKGNPGE
jgi:hypothetical protein